MVETSSKGILIVEDDIGSAEALKTYLDSLGYNKVYIATSLRESLSILSQCEEEIYVVLLDLHLPDGYGLNLMEHLSNNHNFIVGVIVMTAYGDVSIANDFFKMGTDRIISAAFQEKPISFKNFGEQIDRTTKLIDNKRKNQGVLIQEQVINRLENIDRELTSINQRLDKFQILSELQERLVKIENQSPTFLKELGMDLLRVIIIGLAVLAFLYLDFGQVILRIIQRIK